MGMSKPAETPMKPKPRLKPIDSATFAARKPPLDWLVEDVLLAGQPCVLGGPLKCLKTSLAIDLAVSLSTGTPFLGRFPVPDRHRVMVFSQTAEDNTLTQMAHRICQARGVSLADCPIHWSSTLPRLNHVSDRQELRTVLKGERIKVVIIDPLYLCLLTGGAEESAANLYEVGGVLSAVAAACSGAGATPVLVHHTTKSAAQPRGSAPTTLHDLAYAGIGEFARQWLLVSRVGNYRPGGGVHDLVLSVGGSGGHSSEWRVRVDEGSVDPRSGPRKWEVGVPEGPAGDEGAGAWGHPDGRPPVTTGSEQRRSTHQGGTR
jgi:replicative DNA helicase